MDSSQIMVGFLNLTKGENLMADIITTSAFLRTLLMKCIGTVMIEWEQWDFPQPSFDRGYFNDRLKRPVPVNTLTRQRLKRLFENVFSPDNRKGKFQEPQAVEAANAFISLAEKYFHINLSVWENKTTVPAAPICFPVLMWFWER